MNRSLEIHAQMKLAIENVQKADIFVQCFQHMKTFTDSINVTFQEDNMFIQCMDPTMVLIMEFKLPASWFDMYEVREPIVIGLTTSIWAKVLAIRDKSQNIQLSTEDREDYLSVMYHVEDSKTVFDKSFEVPLISIDTDLLQIPEMEYPADIVLPSITFASMISQLKQFGDNMHIECTEEHVQMVSDSEVYGKMNTHIPIDDLEEFAIDEGKTIKCSLGLRMLHNVCSYQKIAKTIALGVSDTYPMKIEYKMDDDAILVFYLAPRVNDDD